MQIARRTADRGCGMEALDEREHIGIIDEPAGHRRDQVLDVTEAHDLRYPRDGQPLRHRRQRLPQHVDHDRMLLALLVAGEESLGQHRVLCRIVRTTG